VICILKFSTKFYFLDKNIISIKAIGKCKQKLEVTYIVLQLQSMPVALVRQQKVCPEREHHIL